MTGSGSDVTPAEERTITAFMQRLRDAPVDVSSRVPARGRAVAQGAAHPAVGTRNGELKGPSI